MRLITEDLPDDLARTLLKYNIRFVEQFLEMLRDPVSAHNLASVSGRSVDALRSIAERIQQEHPDLTIPKPSGNRYGLGYGREKDWKKSSTSGPTIRETGDPEGGGASDTSPLPRLAQGVRRRALQAFHLMALVMTVVLTLVVTPALMKLIAQPPSELGLPEVLTSKTSFALILWTLILAMIGTIEGHFRVRQVSASYGTSAIYAAASALFFLLFQGVIQALIWSLRGYSVLRYPGTYFSPTVRQYVGLAPSGAAAAIVGVWVIFALTGVGRRPSDSFDRLCFVLGLFWVVWCLGSDLMWLL